MLLPECRCEDDAGEHATAEMQICRWWRWACHCLDADVETMQVSMSLPGCRCADDAGEQVSGHINTRLCPTLFTCQRLHPHASLFSYTFYFKRRIILLFLYSFHVSSCYLKCFRTVLIDYKPWVLVLWEESKLSTSYILKERSVFSMSFDICWIFPEYKLDIQLVLWAESHCCIDNQHFPSKDTKQRRVTSSHFIWVWMNYWAMGFIW